MAKLEKIVLNDDIILSVSDSYVPGTVGKILVEQDNLGFHVVELPDGHFGDITIEPHPRKTTLLEYIVSDNAVFWTSTILTPADDVSNPTAITDLTWNYLDATSVQISFNAPSGNQTLDADRYVIYYSNAPITSATTLTFLQTYKNSIVPQSPGVTETFNLTKLTPNQLYYVAVVAQKTTYGKTRTGDVSNIINFTTVPLEGGGADGNTPIIIPIKAKNVDALNTLYIQDDDGTYLDQKCLVDYSNITLVNGVPVGVTPKTMTALHTNQFKTGYYNLEQMIIFDLEDLYTVNEVFLNPVVGSNDKFIYTSIDGVNWALAATIPGDAPKNKWAGVFLDTAVNTNVRYVKMTINENNTSDQYAGFLLIGTRNSAQNIKGLKYKNTTPALSLPDRVGTNSNIINDPTFTATVAKIVRLYSNHQWYLDDIPKYQQGSTGVTLANIGYKFTTSNVGDSDEFYRQTKAAGTDIQFCLVSMPRFLADVDASSSSAYYRKPLDPGLTMTLDNTTNAMNYKFIAQFYWQVAARYGYTSGQTDSLFRLEAGEPLRKGLGYVKYFELGCNEPTAMNPDMFRTTNPEELAAIMSACYDGHMGAMGAGYGIKDADPTAIPVMVGLTSLPVAFKKAMMRWWDVNRAPGNYPIQVINEHYYNVAGGRIVQENTYSQYNLYSSPPEQGEFMSYVQEHVDFRDSTPTIQGMKLMISEVGYDEHLGSPFSPKDTLLSNRGWKKALWTIRTFLIADYLQLDYVLQYAIFGIHYNSELSQTVQNIYVNFSTSGYLDGPNGAANRQPMQNYYYSTAFQKAMVGYKFSHAVRMYGKALTNEVVTKSTDSDLFVFAYKPNDSSKKPMLVAWLGNDSLTKTSNIDFSVTASEISVSTFNFEGLNVSHALVGTSGATSSTVDGSARKITVNVTATPKIIYTSNIGTPSLIAPSEIVTQSITATQIKLAWTDSNIGTNNTKIFRSTSPNSGFTAIYDDYIDTGTYTDSGLAEYTTYYYQIQFEKGSIVSPMSASYGQQTLKTIAVPSGFTHTSQSPSTISLAWGYSAADVAYTDGFELWRSGAIAGTYAKIISLASSATTYVDAGLVANTNYYYKLRAYKGLSTGAYTATLNTTTDPITTTAPFIVSAQTNYSGDRITLTYNLPMADPSGQASYFTVVEAPGTLNRVISPSNIALNSTDNTKVNLFLSSGFTSSASSIQFSYDAAGGTIQSVYGVKTPTTTGHTITNRFLDSTLLTKTIKVNMTDDSFPASSSTLPDWNFYNVANRTYNSVQYVIPTFDKNGSGTTYNFTMVEHAPESHIQNVVDVTPNTTSYFSTANTINSLFPIAVRNIGAEVNATGTNTLIFSLMKLDISKIYNVRIYGWEYPGQLGILSVTGNGTGTAKTMIVSGNTSNTLYITNMKPSNITLPAVSSGATADGYYSNKITVYCTTANLNKVAIQAMIFEEVIDN